MTKTYRSLILFCLLVKVVIGALSARSCNADDQTATVTLDTRGGKFAPLVVYINGVNMGTVEKGLKQKSLPFSIRETGVNDIQIEMSTIVGKLKGPKLHFATKPGGVVRFKIRNDGVIVRAGSNNELAWCKRWRSKEFESTNLGVTTIKWIELDLRPTEDQTAIVGKISKRGRLQNGFRNRIQAAVLDISGSDANGESKLDPFKTDANLRGETKVFTEGLIPGRLEWGKVSLSFDSADDVGKTLHFQWDYEKAFPAFKDLHLEAVDDN